MTREEAIEYCFMQIKPSKMDIREYNSLRSYIPRYRKGKLKDTAIQKLFDRFGVESHCYYKVNANEKS